MKVSAKRVPSLIERVNEQSDNGNRIFRYYPEERMKVYEMFENQYVSNILTEQKIMKWKKGSYFVISQTGSGKSTFVNEVIVPLILERQKRGLLITPRVALSMQYKRDIAQLYCPEKLEELQERGLQKEVAFGSLDIITLQELVSAYRREYLLKHCKEYDFLIFDEVHAYVGDANFNPFTEDILRFLILQLGMEAKRVYITATPGIVLEEIVNIEKEVTSREWPGVDKYGFPKAEVWLTMYRFRITYNYVQPIFFENEQAIVSLLQELPAEEKVVIFVKSKVQGIRFQEKLGKEKALYLDAENKLTSEEETFYAILRDNCFKEQVLIATRFLDVGVNLKDSQIKHIIVFHTYQEEVIQMLGRRRIKGKEQVNLYIKIPRLSEVEQEIKNLESEYESMQNVILKYSYNSHGCFSQLPMPLYISKKGEDGYISYNKFSLAINKYHHEQLQKFSNGKKDNRAFYEDFKQEVLSWLPEHKKPMDLEKLDNTDLTLEGEIKLLLEPLLGSEFDREKLVELSEKILDIFKIPRRNEQKGQVAMNKIKEKFLDYSLPYVIKNLSKTGKTGLWTVKKGVEW
ncbi:DEAD/DEAH box helicase family protein [Lacrimispora sp.]|uniref:DEAD/DEAH box helicase n=1 Tax=Lacrimispora sp. TaxID=2719234 RepID=UPI0029DF9CDB|nr:hypothetical protein [Lacrimispora sp.]